MKQSCYDLQLGAKGAVEPLQGCGCLAKHDMQVRVRPQRL